MSDPRYQPGSGTQGGEHPPHGPAWKRMHHSPFFWVAASFILLAMIIYITTNQFSLRPGKKAGDPVPAISP
jgi:hypothetical protein